jgi:hypothetical protein
MPKYVRYGYMIHHVGKFKGEFKAATNVAFYLNPKLAQERVDSIVDGFTLDTRVLDIPQTIEDTTFKQPPGLRVQVIRRVLIKYLDGSTTEISVERWGVEVGKE